MERRERREEKGGQAGKAGKRAGGRKGRRAGTQEGGGKEGITGRAAYGYLESRILVRPEKSDSGWCCCPRCAAAALLLDGHWGHYLEAGNGVRQCTCWCCRGGDTRCSNYETGDVGYTLAQVFGRGHSR